MPSTGIWCNSFLALIPACRCSAGAGSQRAHVGVAAAAQWLWLPSFSASYPVISPESCRARTT
jgi:hypothetical protein